MAGEAVKVYGDWVVLESGGSAVANAAFAQADDAVMSLAASGYLNIEVELELALAVAASTGAFVGVYAQDLDLFSSADDALPPSATNLRRLVRSESLATGTTAAQRFRFDAIKAPVHAAYWLMNGAGQSIASGWRLRARPWTMKTAA